MEYEYLNVHVVSLPGDAAIAANFPGSQKALQRHAKHPGIWKALKDLIGASSKCAKERKHLKGRFAVFQSRQASTYCSDVSGF